MIMIRALFWMWCSAALAFAGDNLMMRGELRGWWYVRAVGKILFAFALSMLLVAAIMLEEMRGASL